MQTSNKALGGTQEFKPGSHAKWQKSPGGQDAPSEQLEAHVSKEKLTSDSNATLQVFVLFMSTNHKKAHAVQPETTSHFHTSGHTVEGQPRQK